DLTMPGLGGLKTLERIRILQPRLPVLLSSGYPEEALHFIREEASPCSAFIQKPYRNFRLLNEIEALLGSASAAGCASA
ncbi:MAG: hypothetical protein VCB99_07995, partial [Myxococcota bacterium]